MKVCIDMLYFTCSVKHTRENQNLEVMDKSPVEALISSLK